MTRVMLSSLLALGVSWAAPQPRSATHPPAEATPATIGIAGKWVSVNRSMGGIGSMWNFKPGGVLTMSPAAIVDSPYKLQGDKLVLPPSTTEPNAKPQIAIVRFEGDTLVEKPQGEDAGSPEQKMVRTTPPVAGDPPIVGTWKPVMIGPAANHEQEAMRAAYLNATYTYTRKGILKLRVPFRVFTGTYNVAAGAFQLKDRPGSTFHFRMKNGMLYLTRPDGHSEEACVRDDTD